MIREHQDEPWSTIVFAALQCCVLIELDQSVKESFDKKKWPMSSATFLSANSSSLLSFFSVLVLYTAFEIVPVMSLGWLDVFNRPETEMAQISFPG